MDTNDGEICGFLDIKSVGNRYIAQKVRKKALVQSKVWKRLWCSVKKLAPGCGIQIQFDSKLSCGSSTLKQSEKDNSVVIPSNAVVYRIHSKTKQFAFGISSSKDRKPLLSLSAHSETETQRWMANIRLFLKPRRHYCMDKSYNISMVDNAHSKTAGLIGLHGDLIANETGIFIKSVHSGEIIENFKWKEFNQFHLMTAGRPEDVKRICVIHTAKEFRCGMGELYVFCLDANKLLQDLVTQGRGPKHRQKSSDLKNTNIEMLLQDNIVNKPSLLLKCNKSSCILARHTNCLETSINSEEIENIYQSHPANLTLSEEAETHGRSNISIASGIYEEILDNACCPDPIITAEPPPLPPRQRDNLKHVEEISIINAVQESKVNIFNFARKLEGEVHLEGTIADNSNYVPMSPQSKDINGFKLYTTKEDEYVIMQ